MTSQVTEIMLEAASNALMKYNFSGADREEARAMVMKQALQSGELQRRFAYALSDTAFMSDATGEARLVPNGDAALQKDLAQIKLHNVVRVKHRKQDIKIDHYLPTASVEFLNRHYAKEFNISFSHTLHHDHPMAAASRKLETELLMAMIRSRGGDALRSPSNDYEFSIIDVGGDWRHHHVRKHFGVHCDAPFLDDRDRARDVRRCMQLENDPVNDHFVCRNKMQDCLVTAPFMMSVHSVLYTCTILEICEAMAVRGTLCFVGTMQLPENMDRMYSRYEDPDYQYVIDFSDPDVRAMNRYVPPQARAGVGKYLFGGQVDNVTYRYPMGESREYVHRRSIILEKLRAGTYDVNTDAGVTLTYKYSIVKRVGSVAYVEIALDKSKDLANVRPMSTALEVPFDGYQISVDENLTRDFAIRVARNVPVNVPRQLFTAVAAHCLTKVRDPNFSIESAMAYARSAASQIEVNGVIIHKGSGTDRSILIVVAGLASFFWAFDRYRLMESRLEELSYADARNEVQSSIAGTLGTAVDFRGLYSKIKDMGYRAVTDYATDAIMTWGTTYDDLRQIYERISSIVSPGVTKIRDLMVCYKQLQPLRVDGSHVTQHVSVAGVSAMEPAYPMYELPPTARMQRLRQEASGSAVSRSDTSRHEDKRVEQFTAASSSTAVEVTREPPGIGPSDAALPLPFGGDAAMAGGDVDVRLIIRDAIELAQAGEAERDQTAREVYARVFDPVTRGIPDIERLKGTVKGRPTLLHYQEGVLIKVQTLAEQFDKGTDKFNMLVANLAGNRAIYPERVNGVVQFGTGVLRSDCAFKSDKRQRTDGQTFVALIDPSIRVLNASRLTSLSYFIGFKPIFLDASRTVLADEVAGSGKTHSQCVEYQLLANRPQGESAAIFAATKAAAAQAEQRLKEWGVNVREDSVSTVDSFLMSEKKWKRYALVLLDEALQMHAGKVYAVALLTGAQVRGYGDTKQIGYISFTRMRRPGVDTNFPWGSVEKKQHTRRIPQGKMVDWLRSEELYGPEFSTLSLKREAVVLYVQLASFEAQLTVSWMYRLMNLKSDQTLMVLVYLQDQMLSLTAKFGVTNRLPPKNADGLYDEEYPCCVCTCGEAQGEDTDNVLLLRLSSKEEPLHSKSDQTIVAMTRHKKKWGYLAVSSRFPSKLEAVAGVPPVVPSLQAALTLRDLSV